MEPEPDDQFDGQFDGLSFAEERLWWLDRFRPGQPIYNLPFSVTLDHPLGKPLDKAALALALVELIERHEVLRCVFGERDQEPYRAVQAVPPRSRVMRCLDLGGFDAQSAQAEHDRLFVREAFQAFDLCRGPLLRCLLVDAGGEGAVLVVTVHHIVFDGWSQTVFTEELMELYAAALHSDPSYLPELALSYADYSCWQRTVMDPDWLQRELDFWADELEDVPLRCEIPADRPGGLTAGGPGAGLAMPLLAPEWAERFRWLAQRHQATPFMIHLAAFHTLLYRTTGQRELVVGTPVANREWPETERVIGLFVNTLLLRARADGDASFEALLQQVRDRTLDAFSHAGVPFEKIVASALDASQAKDRGCEPIFRMMFALQPAAQQARVTKPGQVTETWVKTDWSLIVRDHTAADVMGRVEQAASQGYSASWEFATDVLDATTVQRLSGQLVRLLEAALEEPSTPLDALPLLAPAQRHQLVHEQRGRDLPVSQVVPLHALVAYTANTWPDRTALVWDGGEADYAALARASEVLALRLSLALGGDGPWLDERVGVALPRSPAQLLALLAVLKTGAAYVPLDVNGPPERLRRILDAARPRLILCSQGQGDIYRRAGARAVLEIAPQKIEHLLRREPGVAQSSRAERASATNDRPVPLEAAAYVIYTSGSGGRPKGVIVSHDAASRHMLWMAAGGHVQRTDRVLYKTAATFDASVWEIFAPWTVGAAVVLAPLGSEADPRLLLHAVEVQQCTLLQVVPSMLAALIPFLSLHAAGSTFPLRRIYSGGEALPSVLASVLADSLPAVELVNLYGPTEATIDTTFEVWKGGAAAPLVPIAAPFVPIGRPIAAPFVPIGRPIAGVSTFVVDSELQLVALGVAGELMIAGANLARGYVGDSRATAAAFVPCPWNGNESEKQGSRMYRSGDRVRRLADGRLEYLGRLDRQVKILGTRFEPAEIEHALMRHAQVREAAVEVATSAAGPQLVAYIVPSPVLRDALSTGEVTIDDLRLGLAQHLPAQAVPSLFAVLQSLPRLASGKLDRHALPALHELHSSAGPAYRPPSNDLEANLLAIWNQALGREQRSNGEEQKESLGVDDNFFALGGNSLSLARVAASIQARLGVNLPAHSLFETPTVAILASRLQAMGVPASGGG